ncbi:MAG: ABC transporter ATP-binding protein [Candidatus Magasanikbacteria bacterium]|jgi:ABC-type branched-subunit amino acid transport system ATPase component|nr:ABC transporter ATP-binding protein [Candidatus Magasanikbacteria bacterium]MBT4071507.1 ABC transporter ATP-binding protein [Candidatus Magasanikbacteria bacterium]
MLEIKKISKDFGGVKAVNNCSFKVEPNTITALIGPNGAGKSTLFNLISSVIKSDTGKIFFDKKDITNLPPEKVSNAGISRLFQKARLFENLTVEDNLLLALDHTDTKFWFNLFCKTPKQTDKIQKVEKMLDMLGMKKTKNMFAKDLSYGQKRLIELGRTILNPHSFLMLDEPVAGVTPELRDKIANILIELKNQGETILLIEHDMNFTLGIADRVIVLDQGSVLIEGTPKQIKNNKQVLKAYLGE